MVLLREKRDHKHLLEQNIFTNKLASQVIFNRKVKADVNSCPKNIEIVEYLQ